jgi:hypothetical protein
MGSNNDSIVFDKMSFSDLMKDIYITTKEKEQMISRLVENIEGMINSAEDASTIGPILRDYIDLSIKNDDHLLKMAGIFQRSVASSQKSSGTTEMYILSEEEKKQLLVDYPPNNLLK